MPGVQSPFNGDLAITFDKDARIRDHYYPQVCLENHVNGHIFSNY